MFDPRRAQLIARGCVLISEVLSEFHAEETHLRGAGLLTIPTILVARTRAALVPSPYSIPPLLPMLLGRGGRSSYTWAKLGPGRVSGQA
jgi:hypothetical protein